MLKGVREGDPHRDTIPLGHGKVEGREGGERGGPTQGHITIRPWQGGREGGRGERGAQSGTQYIPFGHINQLTEPN